MLPSIRFHSSFIPLRFFLWVSSSTMPCNKCLWHFFFFFFRGLLTLFRIYSSSTFALWNDIHFQRFSYYSVDATFDAFSIVDASLSLLRRIHECCCYILLSFPLNAGIRDELCFGWLKASVQSFTSFAVVSFFFFSLLSDRTAVL